LGKGVEVTAPISEPVLVQNLKPGDKTMYETIEKVELGGPTAVIKFTNGRSIMRHRFATLNIRERAK
jgi:hypothetical protein